MTRPHGRFQQAFAKALFSSTEALDPAMRELATQPAFAVYRNTVMKACIDALEANFPAVARLVGSEWFRAAAALYVSAEAPRDGRLLHYGSGFAEFLRGFEPAAELIYLPGVARLDTLWLEAHAAQDASAADAAWVARRTPEQLAALSLRPHPAARWAWFDDQPVFSIWERNRAQGEVTDELAWQGEGALLTRPYDTVTWQGLTQASCVFLDACAGGATLQQAAERALAVDVKADLAAIFAGLLSAGAFTAPSSSPASNERTP
ncbi:DNA-binding domain-containing protein [Variovorax sp. DXTD-1]|uniref:HvfC/BufC N-terminal domain-containing protein n=1 Tax=Variovorax sp. DXTD-1 TaxID=2495592 RepID=UPI000F88B8B8|nr:DNA-binding domain-containing protein [Variovorax sp. DXTD-1]RST53957.1 DUF2063 domain-containing protein [Variovorax sp. DXTD-1]